MAENDRQPGQGNFIVVARRQFDPKYRGELDRIHQLVAKHDTDNEPATLVQGFGFEEPNWMWSIEVYESEEAYRAHVKWHDEQPWWDRVTSILGGLASNSDPANEGRRHFVTGTFAKGLPYPPYTPADLPADEPGDA